MFASLTRSGWQDRAGWYLRGLMVDGRRKSIQPIAARLGGVHEQELIHFVTNSPWDVEPVRARVAELIDEATSPAAWAIDDTGLLKCGIRSPCVARQDTGTAGKVTNCQVAVSVSMVTDTASCPVDWRLFVPQSWDPASPKASVDVVERRAKAGIGDDIRHRKKWRLALDMIDELIAWGRWPPLIVAESGYGDAAEFRHGLAEAGTGLCGAGDQPQPQRACQRVCVTAESNIRYAGQCPVADKDMADDDRGCDRAGRSLEWCAGAAVAVGGGPGGGLCGGGGEGVA